MRVIMHRMLCFGVVWLTCTPGLLSAQSSKAAAIYENPRLSKAESVRFLATFVDALSAIHQKQVQLDALPATDFVGRMTVLRVLSGDTAFRRLAIAPFVQATNDNVRTAAKTTTELLDRYKSVFDANVALYEQVVRIFAVPHELTESEAKSIAESRITTSQLTAAATQLSEFLKDTANLAFASTIVAAPNDPDHVALDMSAGERNDFVRDLRLTFGNLDEKKQLPGVDFAGWLLQVQFAKDWRLAR